MPIIAGDPVSYICRTNGPAFRSRPERRLRRARHPGFPRLLDRTRKRRRPPQLPRCIWTPIAPDRAFPLAPRSASRIYSDFRQHHHRQLSWRAWDNQRHLRDPRHGVTGFRAPGVQQLFYSQRFEPISIRTRLPRRYPDRPPGQRGHPRLRHRSAEGRGTNRLVRLSSIDNDNFSLTVDVFRIDIDDRTFSPTSAGERRHRLLPCDATNSNCPIAAILAPFNSPRRSSSHCHRYRTTGIDIVGEFTTEAAGGTIDLTALLHWNKTEVTSRRSQSAILSPAQLFDNSQVTLIEEGQPGAHHMLQGVYHIGRFDWTLRANYYGSVAGEGFTPGFKQTWDGQTLFDAAVVSTSTTNGACRLGPTTSSTPIRTSGIRTTRRRSRNWASPTAGKRCRSASMVVITTRGLISGSERSRRMTAGGFGRPFFFRR